MVCWTIWCTGLETRKRSGEGVGRSKIITSPTVKGVCMTAVTKIPKD